MSSIANDLLMMIIIVIMCNIMTNDLLVNSLLISAVVFLSALAFQFYFHLL